MSANKTNVQPAETQTTAQEKEATFVTFSYNGSDPVGHEIKPKYSLSDFGPRAGSPDVAATYNA